MLSAYRQSQAYRKPSSTAQQTRCCTLSASRCLLIVVIVLSLIAIFYAIKAVYTSRHDRVTPATTPALTLPSVSVVSQQQLSLSGVGPSVDTGCVLTGCSRQLCRALSAPPLMSTCEWKAEYECYKAPFARCQKQEESVECEWQMNEQMKQCIYNAKHKGGSIA